MKEGNEMKAAYLLDIKLKWDVKEVEDSEGQLCCLMAKCTLVQYSVGYHHDTFAENKTSLFEI